MRAPVQKTRPRRTGKQTAPVGSAERTPGTSTPPQPPEAPVGKGRPTHVRNRLIVAVAVVAAAVAGAGAPSVVAASGQLHDSQELVTLAEQTQGALTLAHSLADERDEVTPYIAAGRPKSKAPSEQRSARVDRQVEELRADPDTPASLREDLDAVAALRRAALTGKSTALQAHEAYSETITELHALAEKLGEEMPPRAGSGAYALAELDTAVQQAAATRGLLLAALNVPSTTETVIDPVTGLPTESTSTSDADTEQRDALAAAAQQARVRSDAALADFREGAPKEARNSFDATVAGPEVNSAEKYLAGLTDQPTLSDGDLRTSTKRLDAALSARVDAMRGAESALYEKRVQALEQLRDDDVTALEIRIAVLGALILLAVGIATALARTLTRPLSVLRRGSARLAGADGQTAQEPIAFTGRNDEFAQVVRSVNALHTQAATLAGRVATLESDRKHLVGQRQKMADAREELRAELAESAAQLEVVRKSIGSTFVNLALRTLGLVERQLAVIESLEEREQDPERLATLFKLDHFATVMRRHSENLLVLAGTEHVQHSASPVPLVDVVRAAVSEIERYERVRIAALPPHAHVAGFAADDLSHLLAELMENATSFSPPDLPVEVSGWLLENGEVMLSVQDEGIGMATERLQRLNARLTDFDPDAPYDQEGEDGLGLGLYVVARLAHRHGARVRLREQKQGGVAAVVVLPSPLLAAAPPAALAPTVPVSDGTGSFSLPGADAEANSNVLHGRAEKGTQESADPLVASAERAVRRAESETDSGADVASESEVASGSETGFESDTGPRSETGFESDAGPGSDAASGVDPDSRPEAGSGPVTGSGSEAGAGPEVAAGPEVGFEAHQDSRSEADTEIGAGSESAPWRPDAGTAADPGSRTGAGSGPEAGTGAGAGPASEALAASHPGSGPEARSGADAGPGVETGSESAAAGEVEGTEPVAAATSAPASVTPPAPGTTRDTEADAVPAPGATPERSSRAAAGQAPETGAHTGPRPGKDTAADQEPGEGTSSREAAKAPGHDLPDDATMALLLPPVPPDPSSEAPAPEQPAPEPDAPRIPGPRAAGPYAIGPDSHDRTPDEGAGRTGDAEPVTEKGLPKRTPKLTTPAAAPRPRTPGSVDADALRRRLGGFRRGAEAGRRDVEAEIADRTGPHQAPVDADTTEEATGGTVEEASS
ncbi:nitrate- and nitrite sensing domain-containing protein [Streptomyces sp. NPDC005549]|uniref:nitrate- and nitrite sensing domain-containing protein n=1 Tax=Streptomyces sp. NPDC005549 TaxID=3154888 RepID=UPI0033B65F22